ncbi:CrcB family protein [Aquisalimonas sp.]|uniref:fluoride efflux transporter FluC n=3 Tax=Aquisalimonas TaxID=406099 RepID=UPI0025C065CC|nr:CrcB family protein [Aquisalimonas sp.]
MGTLISYAAIAAGGAAGGALRYLIGTAVDRRTGSTFPWGTWIVNVSGSLLLGVLAGLVLRLGWPGETWAAALMIGLCGSYTTVSSFSLQSIGLVRDRQGLKSAAYVISSLLACLLAAALGLALTAGGLTAP